jgi:hypothetical protein
MFFWPGYYLVSGQPHVPANLSSGKTFPVTYWTARRDVLTKLGKRKFFSLTELTSRSGKMFLYLLKFAICYDVKQVLHVRGKMEASIQYRLNLLLCKPQLIYRHIEHVKDNFNKKSSNFSVWSTLLILSKGFWRWCVTLITTKLLDFVHRPDF